MPERPTASPATDQPISANAVPAEQEKKSWLDLSPTQVAGGALAAMTAAALGSRFSVEGTVVGAALASVIAAVASALYTASLRRTREAVRVAFNGRRTTSAPTGSTAVTPQPLPGPVSTASESAKKRRRRTVLVSSVVGALATFALAAVALTTFETLTGRALSGGDGTTVSQVQRNESGGRPTEEKSSAPSESPEPSESSEPSATTEPSAEPSVTAESEPTATTEPSAEPSVEPSAEPSATADAEPSATAAEPSSAPSQVQPSR
jgi:hypothetical protein